MMLFRNYLLLHNFKDLNQHLNGANMQYHVVITACKQNNFLVIGKIARRVPYIMTDCRVSIIAYVDHRHTRYSMPIVKNAKGAIPNLFAIS